MFPAWLHFDLTNFCKASFKSVSCEGHNWLVLFVLTWSLLEMQWRRNMMIITGSVLLLETMSLNFWWQWTQVWTHHTCFSVSSHRGFSSFFFFSEVLHRLFPDFSLDLSVPHVRMELDNFGQRVEAKIQKVLAIWVHFKPELKTKKTIFQISIQLLSSVQAYLQFYYDCFITMVWQRKNMHCQVVFLVFLDSAPLEPVKFCTVHL